MGGENDGLLQGVLLQYQSHRCGPSPYLCVETEATSLYRPTCHIDRLLLYSRLQPHSHTSTERAKSFDYVTLWPGRVYITHT